MKKRIIAIMFMVTFILTGCSRTTDSVSLGQTTQNSESTMQDSESAAQLELAESGGGGLAEAGG